MRNEKWLLLCTGFFLRQWKYSRIRFVMVVSQLREHIKNTELYTLSKGTLKYENYISEKVELLSKKYTFLKSGI